MLRVLVLAPLLALALASAAQACSLVPVSDADRIARADIAWEGEVTEVGMPTPPSTRREFVVHVTRVLKGDVPAFLRLAAGEPFTSCALLPQVGQRLRLAYDAPTDPVPVVDSTMLLVGVPVRRPDWAPLRPAAAQTWPARRRIHVTVEGGACDLMRFDGLTRRAGTVRPRFSRAPDPQQPGPCIQVLVQRCLTVVLDRPLGDRRVVGVGDGPRPSGRCTRVAPGAVVAL